MLRDVGRLPGHVADDTAAWQQVMRGECYLTDTLMCHQGKASDSALYRRCVNCLSAVSSGVFVASRTYMSLTHASIYASQHQKKRLTADFNLKFAFILSKA